MMRLHSAMGLFLGHKTLTGSAQTGYELTWVRVGIEYMLTWVRVHWHMDGYSVCILMHDLTCTIFNTEGTKAASSRI